MVSCLLQQLQQHACMSGSLAGSRQRQPLLQAAPLQPSSLERKQSKQSEKAQQESKARKQSKDSCF
jgi:hypothetical protein